MQQICMDRLDKVLAGLMLQLIVPCGLHRILQELGLPDARRVIPRWLQQHVIDILDKVLAGFMLRMITSMREEPPAVEGDSNRRQTDSK
jgi:hypothetical protein